MAWSNGHEGLNRQHRCGVLSTDALQLLIAAVMPIGNVIFFVARGRNRIHRRGMSQHFVLADQRGRRDLRHHGKPELSFRALSEKRGQTLAESGVRFASGAARRSCAR